MTSTAQPDVPGIDRHHLLVVGARDIRRLTDLARDLHTTGAIVDTVAADASDPEGFQAALSSVYAAGSAPGLMVYNAVLAAPDTLLESDISHLQRAYNVDVVSAIVAAQVAAEAMRTAGGGTILFYRWRLRRQASRQHGDCLARQGGTAVRSDHARRRTGVTRRARCQYYRRGDHRRGHSLQSCPYRRRLLDDCAARRQLAERIPVPSARHEPGAKHGLQARLGPSLVRIPRCHDRYGMMRWA